MEDIAINICDICNLKDLSGLTPFNKNFHIAACQKKADKLKNYEHSHNHIKPL